MKKIATLFLGYLLSSTSTFAQSGNVQFSGPITPGHVGVWVTSGILQDGGTANSPTITDFGMVSTNPDAFCVNSAVAPNPFYQLCLGVSPSTGGTISFGAVGSLPTLGLNCIINNISQSCLASAGGSSGQLQVNNAGSFAGITLGGDCTFATPNIACTRLNGITLPAAETYCNPTTSPAAPLACRTVLHSLDWGLTGNGSTNDTTKAQAFLSECQSTGQVCYFDPPPTCYLVTGLSVSGPIRIDGPGLPANVTTVAPMLCNSSATGDLLDISVTSGAAVVENITLGPNTGVTSTAGNSLKITSSAAASRGSKISNVGFIGGFVGLDMNTAIQWQVQHDFFFQQISAGAAVEEWGDSEFTDNNFVQLVTAGAGTNNGLLLDGTTLNFSGLKLHGNKWLSAATSGTTCAICYIPTAAGAATSLIADGPNDIVGWPVGIQLTKGSSTSLTNAKFDGFNISAINACAQTDTGTSWATNLTFNSLICTITGTGSTAGVSFNNLTDFTMMGGIFDIAAGTVSAISVGANAFGGQVCWNRIYGAGLATTPIANASTAVLFCDQNGALTGGLPAVIQNGSLIYNTSSNCEQVFFNNTPFCATTTAYTQISTVTTSGTGAVNLLGGTGVGSTTVQPNFLLPGKTIRTVIEGTLTTAATPGTLTMAVALGATTLTAVPAFTPTASLTSQGFRMEFEITDRAPGSGGTVFCQGRFFSAAGNQYFNTTATATVNTTASQVLTATSTNSVSGGAVLTVTNATVEYVN